MEENQELLVEDVESGCSSGSSDSDSFIDDSSDVDEVSVSEPLSDKEIEELIDELFDKESEAAEAQEKLEEESLAKMESEIREELLTEIKEEQDLETAVADEMAVYVQEWETRLDELENEIAHLIEQLDHGARIDLPSLYKHIESQAPSGCSTDAWKKRIHWVGSQAGGEFNESRDDAEKYLQKHRPVRRKHGKLLEDGASGFLQKKLAEEKVSKGVEVDWNSLNTLFSDGANKDGPNSFGSEQWASVYLASTPQQAAKMGLIFPGVNEVEEIDDIDGDDSDPFVAAAVANERELGILSEEQKKTCTYRKVKEEDDAKLDKKLQVHLKRRRHQKRCKVDDEAVKSGDLIVCSSDSDSDTSDVERKRKKKIRRIIDDAELGQETQRKIAIEKERQEHLMSLQEDVVKAKSIKSSKNCNEERLGDASAAGCIVNVVRETGEEAVRIPPSISAKLKAHQITGVRFMWQNIIQSIRQVKSGDKGLGCILAHMMGLGKTLQVIAFLYTAMRSIDLGLKTALVVTPVNVLHNWRQEFLKWKPSEVDSLRVFMLEDVPRDRRVELLVKWRSEGGVLLIGYSTFRILALGKRHVKDQQTAREISHALLKGPDILVCDEAHVIKNTKSDVTQALQQVRCQRRIALTGSPLQNNLLEYYCMVDFVREGFLGSSHEFKNRFQNPIENGQHTNSTAEDVKIMNQRSHILYQQLKGFVQRMDMSAVKKDLPPKTVFVIDVKLSPLQKALYKRFLYVHGFTNGKINNDDIRKTSFFAGYQALAHIWNHPGILHMGKGEKEYVKHEDGVENFHVDDSSSDENTDGFLQKDWWNDLLHENNYKDLHHSGKMVLLVDILSMCSDVGDKALVFSQSIATLDLIELYLSRLPRSHDKFWKKGKDWFRLDGSTESSERQQLVDHFNDPVNKRVKCTLISTRAGSLGINLQAANRVIIFDGSWNPTYDLQAIYRAWRYGQTKPVFAYRLMAHGTMEEKIYKRQITKESLAARVVDKQQVHRTMSKEEMLYLFEFDDDENHEHYPYHGNCSSDKMMESLHGKHYPRWIANFHLHETLLQENEEEKLSKEEQDMAWEVYRKSMQWEEVEPLVPLNESAVAVDQKPASSNVTSPAVEMNRVAESKVRDKFVQRKCSRTSHILTLRSQGIKYGCVTVCGECAREISWEDFFVRQGK